MEDFMQELVQWVMSIEQSANELYTQAAHYFKNNQKLSQFLHHLAEDEALHYHAIASAAQYYRTKPLPHRAVSIDPETKAKVEGVLANITRQIHDQSLTEQSMLAHVVATEFSEWNDIFLYVLSCLKDEQSEFSFTVAKIQHHKRYVEDFLETNAHGKDLLKKLRSVPPIWTEKILVVDDEPMVSQLIKAVLQGEGAIDIANDGQEAMQRIKKNYYKLVISDVDMPNMNGIAFYHHAIELFPSIKNRFIFYTGNASSERTAFFEQHNMKYLLKPAPINVLRSEALKLLIQ
jgi:CheY-like chemotaxis protein